LEGVAFCGDLDLLQYVLIISTNLSLCPNVSSRNKMMSAGEDVSNVEIYSTTVSTPCDPAIGFRDLLRYCLGSMIIYEEIPKLVYSSDTLNKFLNKNSLKN
jgi:hypothetical protein